jgi:uncharacterized protein YbbC (DUF1343 family)/CubicO group peptidase (beta-lactamase class C family)
MRHSPLKAPRLLFLAPCLAAALVALPGQTSRFSRIDELVEEAIARHQLPGAVVLIGRGDAVLYERAFGHRALLPDPEPMTEDTIFDLASLTKVVATTTSVMQLMEQGRLRLNDRVARFIPEFARYGKSAITIRHLLTHVSGLRPDLDLAVEFAGVDEAIRRAVEEVPVARPGERFIYSDINFLLLGEIVSRVSGERLDRYVRSHIFDPLEMRETMFLPPESLRPRIAPTERCEPRAWPCSNAGAPFLRGIVHDPTARRMGGIAGHAGLFSTAADVSRFCRMLAGAGSLGSARILSPAAVAKMTTPATPPDMAEARALGWDVDSPLSSNRGELLPVGSFGHTGFTGTSLWIEPHTKMYVVFLSNRVHPDGKGDVTALRANVATVAAAAVLGAQDLAALSAARLLLTGRDFGATGPTGGIDGVGGVAGIGRGRRTGGIGGTDPVGRLAPAPALAGIDVLEAEGFSRLRGKRVALLTNQSGRTRSGARTIDAVHDAKDVTLVALFSPEHGLLGQADARVPDSRDEKTGLPIFSLYSDTRRPTEAMLQGVDAILVDLQDIGSRFYTYPASVAYAMEEAARHRMPVIVLDRPNPIGGFALEGPMQDPQSPRFTGYVRMPIRHGLTIGELARLFNEEAGIGADLTVVPMKGWRRDEWFDETGLSWINPSPNMRNMTAATLYPGIGAIEGTNISVGRGTEAPFEQIGAPWIDGAALAPALNARALAGIRFYPISFTPLPGAKLGGEICHGVFMIVTDREGIRPVRVGLEIASALARMYGARFSLEDAARLFGPAAMLARIRAGDDPSEIAASWSADEADWRLTRAKYLLY